MVAYKDPLDPRAREARRKHYRSNKAQYLERNKKVRELRKKWLKEKKDVPCFDCGNKFPSYVMDFDHRDPKSKMGLVSRLVRWSWKKLEEEALKCDVVCANCHRIRTYGLRSRIM